jgi:hypothetical protein
LEQNCGVARGEVFLGIKVALSRAKSKKKTTEEKGGRHHGLDTFEHRSFHSSFGCHLSSSYLETEEPHFPPEGMSAQTHVLRKGFYLKIEKEVPHEDTHEFIRGGFCFDP